MLKVCDTPKRANGVYPFTRLNPGADTKLITLIMKKIATLPLLLCLLAVPFGCDKSDDDTTTKALTYKTTQYEGRLVHEWMTLGSTMIRENSLQFPQAARIFGYLGLTAWALPFLGFYLGWRWVRRRLPERRVEQFARTQSTTTGTGAAIDVQIGGLRLALGQALELRRIANALERIAAALEPAASGAADAEEEVL